MPLYLVQHGQSRPKTDDPEQGLSEEGIATVKRIAGVARGYRVHVNRIFHSGKKRARQTAELLEKDLSPSGGIEERAGLHPLDDVSEIAATLQSSDHDMLVGHLPFMERLVSFLITGGVDTLVFRFQNGGIVCLDQDNETGKWFIKWALMPSIG
mgnify:CR=1 FL=1